MSTRPLRCRAPGVILALLVGGLPPFHALRAAEEICTSCGPRVSVSGTFSHRKEAATVAIEAAANKCVVEAGDYELLVGAASDDLRLTQPLAIGTR